VTFLQILYSVVVADAGKRRLDLFELGKIAANRLQNAPLLQAAFDDEVINPSARSMTSLVRIGDLGSTIQNS